MHICLFLFVLCFGKSFQFNSTTNINSTKSALDENLKELNGTTIYTTLYAHSFKSDQQFDAAVKRMFESIDEDGDGLVSIDEIVDKVNEKYQPGYAGASKFEENLVSELEAKDMNSDGKLSRYELSEAMHSSLNVTIAINKEFCKRVKSVLMPCSRSSFFTFKNVSSSFDMHEAAIITATCNSGISSLNNYITERCILAVENMPEYKKGGQDTCIHVKECVNKHFGFDKQQSALEDAKYVQGRYQTSVSTLKWSTLIFLFSITFAFIPFLEPLFLVAFIALIPLWIGLIGTFIWSRRIELHSAPFDSLLDKYTAAFD